MQKPLSQRVAESQKQQQHVHRQLGQVLNNYESSGLRSKQKKNDRSAARAEQEAAAARAVNSPPSCAIVGNGGRLRYETHGEEIDAADVVVRFNNGRTKGFERQVGRRSHFRFYNGPSVEPKQAGEVTVAEVMVAEAV